MPRPLRVLYLLLRLCYLLERTLNILNVLCCFLSCCSKVALILQLLKSNFIAHCSLIQVVLPVRCSDVQLNCNFHFLTPDFCFPACQACQSIMWRFACFLLLQRIDLLRPERKQSSRDRLKSTLIFLCNLTAAKLAVSGKYFTT